jgi:hypothetical protein
MSTFEELLERAPRPLRAVARLHPTRGDLACGGRLAELECGHLGAAATLQTKAVPCSSCAATAVTKAMLDDFLHPSKTPRARRSADWWDRWRSEVEKTSR